LRGNKTPKKQLKTVNNNKSYVGHQVIF